MENEEENELKPRANEFLGDDGRFKIGNPGGGRPKDTEETKALRKATKQIITDYREALSEALPFIQPVLIAKAIDGDMTAIKEIHDRTMDKARQATDITTNGESIQPLLVKFIDGTESKQLNSSDGDTNRI